MLIDDFYNDSGNMYPRPDVVFKLQNVADYAWHSGFCTSFPKIEDVFSLRRPFMHTWFEFHGRPGLRGAFGIFSMEKFFQEDELFLCRDDYFYGQDGSFMFLGKTIAAYDDLGTHVPLKDCARYYLCDGEERNADAFESLLNLEGILLLALNFLHCKNVTVIEQPLRADEVRVRKAEERDWFEKYYTLQIDPITKILDTKGQAQTKGIKHALHICRGHFKTYGSKGLFGRYPGTYFWPAHVRGDAKRGVIHKDYSIKMGKEN